MPVLRSGSFVLYGFTLSDPGALLDGDTAYENPSHDPSMEGKWGWQNWNTDQFVTYPTTVTFFGPTLLDTTTEGTGLPAAAPPLGFTIHNGLAGPDCTAHVVGCAGAGVLGTVDLIGLTGQCGAGSYRNEDPSLIYLTLLTFYQLHLTATVGLVSGGISKAGPWSTPTTGLRVTGGYDIVAYWWTIAGLSPPDCRGTDEVPAGAIDGSNPDFTTARPFRPGELRVCVNGSRTSAFSETSPTTFTFDVPPAPGDRVRVGYDLPEFSPCGERQDSHLQLAAEDPGAPWVRLDPLDADAAPTPVIALITPDHGDLDGTAIVIDGSGFGDGCSVAIDGVPCTDLVVESQFRLRCTTPAHAAGLETVVVTNEDGVTS